MDPVRIRPDPETVDPVEIRIRPDPECLDPAGIRIRPDPGFVLKMFPTMTLSIKRMLGCQHLTTVYECERKFNHIELKMRL